MNNRTVALGAFAFLAACSGNGGNATVEVGTTSSNLTAPPDATVVQAPSAAPHLRITVTSVSVHVAGNDGPNDAVKNDKGAPQVDDTSGWITVFSGNKTLDLADTAEVEAFLASAPIPAGKVTQIRLILAGDATLVEGSNEIAVSCPSCTQTGLKIVTRGEVTVPSGGTLHLTLDFDQGASLSANGDAFTLNPTIKVSKETLK
jgi:hypothetical protein